MTPLTRVPKSARNWKRLGHGFTRLRLYPLAAMAFEQAARRAPRWGEARKYLRLARRRNKVPRRRRRNARILGRKLRVLANRSQSDRIDELLANIDQHSPEELRLVAARFLGSQYRNRSHHVISLLTGIDDRADVLVLRARALVRLGRWTEARSVANQGLELEPDNRTARLWRDRAAGELRSTRPGWRPAIPPAGSSTTPKAGRILHLVTNSLPHKQSGYTVRSQSIMHAQRRAGLDPHLATPYGYPGPEDSDAEVDGIPYHHLAPDSPLPSAIDRRIELYAEAVARLVDDLKPAVLHPASTFHNAIVALAVGTSRGIPVVYEARGFQEDSWAQALGKGASESERYFRRMAAEVDSMKASDVVVTLSSVMKQAIVAMGVSDDKIRIVPTAVNGHLLNAHPRDEVLAAQLGIGDNQVVVGLVSSFVDYEGIEYLIQATAHLRDRGHDVVCLLVGDGSIKPSLEKAAAKAQVSEQVVFTGRVPHRSIRGYYELIDVFVIPRTDDQVCHVVTPLKPFEAMATARAVAVSRVEALEEIVDPGVTGVIFEPEDSLSLADSVEPLLTDPQQRTALGERARNWVLANHTWQTNGELYRSIYEELGAV